NTKHETRNRRSETRNPDPETRNPNPETRNPKPEIRNPKPETRNTKPETLNPNPLSGHAVPIAVCRPRTFQPVRYQLPRMFPHFSQPQPASDPSRLSPLSRVLSDPR
ncbi:hypothetical protein T484DRAFT_1617632, partial [Baffinella frigidus]